MTFASHTTDALGSDLPTPQALALELTLEEMGFLRLLLTHATVQPAAFKKLCGEVQAKVEAQIGPLPVGQ